MTALNSKVQPPVPGASAGIGTDWFVFAIQETDERVRPPSQRWQFRCCASFGNVLTPISNGVTEMGAESEALAEEVVLAAVEPGPGWIRSLYPCRCGSQRLIESRHNEDAPRIFAPQWI